MTRKKWNRLKRQRPELFKPYVRTSWEKLDKKGALEDIKRIGKAELIATLTGDLLGRYW